MEILLTLLVGVLMGAFNFAFFLLGYYLRSTKQEDGVTVTKENAEFIKEMMQWRNYGGE